MPELPDRAEHATAQEWASSERKMSPRERTQRDLIRHLCDRSDVWNRDVLDGLEAVPRGGKVRTVTWGRNALLDAVAYIWSPTHIEVVAEGPLAHAVRGQYASLDELKRKLADVEGPRRA